jgi:hypothetical protein
MWVRYRREQSRGRTPPGAELDRVAGTNNYGRTVLRQWRSEGRISPADQDRRSRGGWDDQTTASHPARPG